MQFLELKTVVIDFVFKCKHISKDQQIIELSDYETKHGNLMFAYKQLDDEISKENVSDKDIEIMMTAKYDILKTLNINPVGSSHFFKYEHVNHFLENVLHSNDNKAIELVLELLSNLQTEQYTISVCRMILDSILNLMKHDDTGIIDINTKVLGKLCITHTPFCLPIIMKSINALGDMNTNSNSESNIDSTTIVLRYIHLFHSIFISTSNTSTCEELFETCVQQKCIDFIIGLIRSDDMLIQMVALEYVSIFSTSSIALEYFVKNHHFEWLISCAKKLTNGGVTDVDVEPMISTSCLNEVSDLLFTVRKDTLLVDSFLLMFTNEMFVDIQACVNTFMESEDEGERAAGLAALTALCSLGSTYMHHMLSSPVLDDWYSLLNSGPEPQSAMLTSIATILHSYLNVPDEEYQRAKSDLFHLVANVGHYRRNAADTMSYLLSLGNSPVDNTHMAAIGLMNAIAIQGQKNITTGSGHDKALGLTYLFGHLEFYLYLINRSTEYNKAGKDLKFELIMNITKQPQYQLLNNDIISVIQHIVEGGPYVSPHGNGETADVQTMEL